MYGIAPHINFTDEELQGSRTDNLCFRKPCHSVAANELRSQGKSTSIAGGSLEGTVRYKLIEAT